MKLLFDLQSLQTESRNRGIGRYVQSLFDALATRDDITLYGLLNAAIDETFDEAYDHVSRKIGADRVLVFPGIAGTRLEVTENLHRWRLSQAAYEAFVREAGCDALLVGSAVEGFIDGTSLSLSDPSGPYLKAVILHDLIPLCDIEKYLSWDKARNWYFDRIAQVEAADLLLANSNSSRDEGLRFLDFGDDSIATVSAAVEAAIFHTDGPPATELLESLGIDRPFVMHTSAIEPRKNFEGLVRAFAQLPADLRQRHQLVLVGGGSPEAREDLRALAAGLGLAEADVVIPGFIPDTELAQLYRSARLFVFPSFHEGFGLPALEAMACGCPTIGSGVTGIPEVIGTDAYCFNPHDSSAIAAMMANLLADHKAWRAARRHALRQAGKFSWSKVADRTVAAIKAKLVRPSAHQRMASAARMAAHVAGRVDLHECPGGDLEALARCLAASEDELVAKQAAILSPADRKWRIEGPFDSSYSLALVNRETARAMADLGWDVALFSTEGPGDFAPNPDFLAANPDLAAMAKRAAKTTQASSFATSRLLYPPRVADMRAPMNALHHYAWEESGFPQEWADEFNQSLTFLSALSDHVAKIMVDNGVSIPIAVTGNGIDHWERITADPEYGIEARGFRFLHVSACFPRKGVDALLAAYEAAFTIDDDVSLIIKTFDNPHNQAREMLDAMQARNPRFPHVVLIFADLPENQLKAIYEQCDVLVGPSFAEGFGLPFAEAMLSGIPVITTAWGGQLEFCNPGNSWLVDFRFERARSHFGLWCSAWARVDVAGLTNALLEAHATDRETRAAMAARGREQLMARHRWPQVAQRLTAAAATLPHQPRRNPRIGWISTWHSRCGIATYSQHLVDAIPGEVRVFSPVNEESLVGPDRSIRSWRLGKADSALWRVLAHSEAADCDVFVVQFNYGFYNHADLTRFIAQAKEMGKAVVAVLHSTIDPTGEADVANYNLAWLAPGLSRCDRILVHAIDDLNRLKDLGLIDNVALFPHGVLRRKEPPQPRGDAKVPVIATYGFALPQKGLQEILGAVRLLLDRGRPVRLRMVNAEYPNPVSAEVIDSLKRRIDELGLTLHVELHNRFLTDEESLALLSESDLVAFPYQRTAESASGAVRYGMAVERPVAVTPLPIFADLEGAVFRLPGMTEREIADGLDSALSAIRSNTRQAVQIAEQAARWRSQHDYGSVGQRLFNICKSITNA